MKVENWLIVNGEHGKISEGRFTLDYNEKFDEKNYDRRINVIDIASDKLFNNGTISFKFKTNTENTGMLCIFASDNQELVVGHSFDANKFGIWSNTKSITSSSLKHLDLNREHKIKIEVLGSNIKLYVNNIEICTLLDKINENQMKFRISTDGQVELYDIQVHSIKPKAFVVMQFSDAFNELYSDVILPICNDFKIEAIRADDIYNSTPILQDIIDNIEESDLVIVDITPDNPNVYYELGYAHAINKTTILLCDKNRTKLPFDISSYRTLFYENSIAGKRKVEESLRKYIENSF